MGFPFDDYPENAKDMEEPEHYRTERVAQEAHRIIEDLSRPKERKPPVEVQQAHRIGSLESDVKHMEREAYTQSRRADQAETEAKQLRAECDTLARELREVKKDRDEWKESSLKHQKLHKDLLNKRRRGY